MAFALLTIYDLFGVYGAEKNLNLFLSRKERAAPAGDTREQVSRVVKRFTSNGVVHVHAKRMDVLDIAALK